VALKKHLTEEERYNLSDDQVYVAEKWLKQHQTKGTLSQQEAMPLYEMRLLGYSYIDISIKYSNIQYGKLLLTAALNHWERDADNISSSVFNRIKATMVRSTVEQVEMLTSLISVYNAETNQEIRNYLKDPINNPAPSNRIQNFKELQRTIEMLGEVTNAVKSLSVAEKVKPAKVPKAISAPKAPEEGVILAELAGDKDD
jgi:hypothetical protein